MKSAAALILLGLTGIAVAKQQDLSDGIPKCAVACLDTATQTQTNCEVSDYGCQCQPDNQSTIQDAASPCIISACGINVATG